MMKIFTQNLIFLVLILLSLFSCTYKSLPEPELPLNGLVKLKEGFVTGASAKIEIWGTRNFFAGYNKLVAVVYDSLKLNNVITDAHIDYMPELSMNMDAMNMTNGCPVEFPDETAIDRVFPGAIIFIAPTTADQTWKLKVMVHNHKYNKEGEVEFDITVDNSANPLIYAFTSPVSGNSNLFVSLVQPENPKVGINDVEFTIHKLASLMDFPADDSFNLEITAEMPAIGTFSTNNVNPVNVGNGHYKGKVNLAATGEWHINVAVKKGGETISNNLFFNIKL